MPGARGASASRTSVVVVVVVAAIVVVACGGAVVDVERWWSKLLFESKFDVGM